MSDPKKTTGIIVGVAAFIVAFSVAYFVSSNLFSSKDSSIVKEMKKAVVEINGIAPMQVDEYTRLDSASVIEENGFAYHYTLFHLTKDEVDLDTVVKYVRPEVIQRVRTNPDMKFFRDNEITVFYKYYDKSGKYVTEIGVTPELYKQ